ncbi:hypothetical protein A3F06_03190 [candidate division TM6 bacterium RIFCSPHIGHO2_12_FULL_36_22]|nr:MAG: hypothetical protein A3F06_03190 [candidate division TM6 bacterium RIFCSPHIGHO2_12_FULL_36_22]
MKRGIRLIMMFGLALGVCSSIAIKKSDHVITFFVRPYPEVHPNKPIGPSMFHPGQIYKNLANQAMNSVGSTGVFAAYGGYLAHTNENGQIIFPRKTQTPIFDLFVTNNIHPYLMAGTTNVRYWTVDQDTAMAQYKIQRQQDPQTKLYYWEVSKVPVSPKRIIPLHSIILFAKPKNVYVPLGITLTNKNPQLILPTIYTKPQLDDVKNALLVMNMKIFFQPLHPEFKQDKLSIAELIKP